MANLVGTTLNQAMLALEQYQLTVAAIHYSDDKQLAEDTVNDHKPRAGYPVSTGAGVELSVNRRNRQALPAGRSGVELFRYRVPTGFLRSSVRVHLHRPYSAVELFDAYVRPGEEIWLLIPFKASSTLFLYVDDELIKTKHYNRLE
jgi:serine/threonine-protein kinase